MSNQVTEFNNSVIGIINKSSGEKNHSISFARFIAMIFIIVCHFFQYYEHELAYWFNVGVQIFLCISGFLYGGKKIDDPMEFYCKNFKKILIPYYSFIIPVTVVYYIFRSGCISILSVAKAIFCSGTIKGLGHLWFISYILLCYLITPVLSAFYEKMKNVKVVLSILFTVCLIGICQILSVAYDSYFIFSRISCYIAGYFLSFVLKTYGERTFRYISYICVLMAVVFNLIKIYVKYCATFMLPGFQYIDQYAHVMLGISVFLVIFLHCKNIKENKVLQISDKYSYYVYIVHQLLILSPFSLMAVTGNSFVNWVIVIIGIFVLALVLEFVSGKVARTYNSIERIIYRFALSNNKF